MDISVVICTYNRSQSLSETLRSLAQMEVPTDVSWEVVVVDNNSSDDTRAAVDEFARTSGLNVRYFFEGKQGKSYALNTGVQKAQGEIIAFTDDDVIVDKNWLANLKRAFDEFACIGVAGRVHAVWSSSKPGWVELEGRFRVAGPVVDFDRGNEPLEMKGVPPAGANMAFRREAFERHGVFRTDLGPLGAMRLNAEDSEFGWRLLQAGEKIVYFPSAVIHHPVEPYRATRSYFLSWYFASGRSLARIEGWPQKSICYFGVPRYKFRELATGFVKWVTTLDRKKRFYSKLQAYICAGWIYEAYKMARQRA